MELFGSSLESIYLTTLVVSAACMVLYILFGDIVDGVVEGVSFINPILILAFITFTSASGYLLELLTGVNSWLIGGIAAIVALLFTILFNVFILIPLSSSEESLVYTEDSLKGRMGRVILTIPEDGFGEVVIEGNSGTIAKSAVSLENECIKDGTEVLIIDVQKGVVYVTPHTREHLYS
ncbi:membrane protein [Bacillus coahuilensis p1.1.43]|uniref:Membrane protein n=1 Tax=Bacillus coahuilensis p1.1.43 TaxID=1150625 RepID=A0A147KC05_9BACI|nr:NfeD family protein [Bacillus coahuilensis]KUP09100.1 membrane protein [Bacillus coahuilensis p1.1.43]